MPIDLGVLGSDGRSVYREWQKKIKEHGKYQVKNKYHKEGKMELWNKELNDLNLHYRKLLKNMQVEKKKEMIELEKAAKEAEKAAKQAEKKAKEEKAVKRKEQRIKKKKELANLPRRKSVRLAKKEKKPRCPNGTRRNQKTGNCEKKST